MSNKIKTKLKQNLNETLKDTNLHENVKKTYTAIVYGFYKIILG